MKREGNLIHKIADIDNLRFAFWKARKGKDAKYEVIQYRKSLGENLLLLQKQILTNSVPVGNYHYFQVYDPKQRTICAASFLERVLHHAIMNICHNNFEKYQIFDSYASRISKGTYKAIERAQTYQKKYKWFLKLDVRKYFDSVEQNVLKNLLKNRFKDKRLLKLFSDIIDSYQTSVGRGVPIGNLTSQYFANHYLAVSDHYIKENLKVPAYVRYMDDMVLWSNNKTDLLQFGRELKQFISKELKLGLKPFCLNSGDKGLPFLGYLVFPKTIKLAKRSRKRFVKKLNSYNHNLAIGIWGQSDYQKHVLPLIAFTEKAQSLVLRKDILACNYAKMAQTA